MAGGGEGGGLFAGSYTNDVEFGFAEKIDLERLPKLGGKRITDKTARQSNLPLGVTDRQANWIRQHRPGNDTFQNLVSKDKGFDSLVQLFELKDDIQEIRELKEQVNIGFVNTKLLRFRRFQGLSQDPTIFPEIEAFTKLETKTGKQLANFIKDISGAAVSEQEAVRLGRNIANVDMQDNQFITVLDDYEDDVQNLINSKLKQYDLDTEEELRAAVTSPVEKQRVAENRGSEKTEFELLRADPTLADLSDEELKNLIKE